MKKKMTRHEQRVAVFQLLFEHCFRQDESASDIYLSECDDRGYSDYSYIRETFVAADARSSETDVMIGEYAVGWSLDRLSVTARSLLRLSIYELLESVVPPKVVINEAVEISKEYSSEEEASFINGILNKIARDKGLLDDNKTEASE